MTAAATVRARLLESLKRWLSMRLPTRGLVTSGPRWTHLSDGGSHPFLRLLSRQLAGLPLRGRRGIGAAPARKREREDRPAVGIRLHPRAPADRLDRLAHDAEPEAGPLDARHG